MPTLLSELRLRPQVLLPLARRIARDRGTPVSELLDTLTVEDVTRYERGDLLRQWRFGERALQELEDALDHVGAYLGE